jgi:hypothetical protein
MMAERFSRLLTICMFAVSNLSLSLDTLWFEIAVMTSIFAFGQLFFGAFAEENSKGSRLVKMIIFISLAPLVSTVFGRVWFFVVLGLFLCFFLYVHAWYLPKNGVNGFTGEPKERYEALRKRKRS